MSDRSPAKAAVEEQPQGFSLFGYFRLIIPYVVLSYFMINSFLGSKPALESFILVLAVLIISTLLTFLFGKVRIKGKIFLVCLLSALLPLFLVFLALFRQIRLMEDHADLPMAQKLLQFEARFLDSVISERLARVLQKILQPEEKQIGATQLGDFYRKRSEKFDFPLLSVESTDHPWEKRKISFEFVDVRLSNLTKMISRYAEINIQTNLETNANPKISISVKDAPIGEILGILNQIKGIEIKKRSNAIVVETSRVVPEKIPSSVFSQSFSKSSKTAKVDQMELVVSSTGESLFLTIEFNRKNQAGTTLGRAKLAFNYGVWIQDQLTKPMPSMPVFISIPIFSVRTKLVEKVFSGFAPLTPDRSGHSAFPIDHDDRVSKWAARVSLPELVKNLTDPPELPRPLPYGFDQGLRLKARNSEDAWILQGFQLLSSNCLLTLAVPAKTVYSALRRQQLIPLIFCLAAVVLLPFLSVIYSSRISRPLQEINETARQIQAGNLEVEFPKSTGQDEVQELSETLKMMANALKGKIQLANRQIQEEKHKFETLLSSTWEGILLIDPSGTIKYSNPACQQLFRRDLGQASFVDELMSFGTKFHPPLPNEISPDISEIRLTFQQARGIEEEKRIFSLYLRSLAHEDSSEASQAGFIVVIRDVTIEQEIDRMKTEFVSQVSHELRTPLTSIQAYTEMLLDNETEDKQQAREYLGIIHEESERLTRLINELLDIARIESGRKSLKIENVSLSEITLNIVNILRNQAERKKIAIETLMPEEPVSFFGDGDLLRQCGLNLLSNAIKYTPKHGKITISIEKSKNQVTWTFQDTGIGLTDSEKERLFTKFFRSESEYVRSNRGTGLGLSLVKGIVDRHEGKISVESIFGKGSTFAIVFFNQKLQSTVEKPEEKL